MLVQWFLSPKVHVDCVLSFYSLSINPLWRSSLCKEAVVLLITSNISIKTPWKWVLWNIIQNQKRANFSKRVRQLWDAVRRWRLRINGFVWRSSGSPLVNGVGQLGIERPSWMSFFTLGVVCSETALKSMVKLLCRTLVWLDNIT